MRLISWLCNVVRLYSRKKSWDKLNKKAIKLEESGQYQEAIIVVEQAL